MKFDLNELNLGYARWFLRHNRKQRLRLYRKLGGMLGMGHALPIVINSLWMNVTRGGKKPNHPVALVLKEWQGRIKAGASLAEAMEGSLPDRDIMLIRAGEESGALTEALEGIQTIDTAAQGMRAALSKAISYPVLLFLMLAGILWMFGVTLIDPLRETAPPQVVQQLASLGAISDFIRNYGIITLGLIVAAIAFIILAMPNWRGSLRIKFDKIPPWSWYRVNQGATFLLGMSALLKAQVPLKRALEILEEQSNPYVQERISATRLGVLRGLNLGKALGETKTGFPDPQISIDMEVLSERGDVGFIIDAVTKEWLDDQTERLDAQANVSRLVGMALVGGTIAWAMLSLVGITQQVANTGGSF